MILEERHHLVANSPIMYRSIFSQIVCTNLSMLANHGSLCFGVYGVWEAFFSGSILVEGV